MEKRRKPRKKRGPERYYVITAVDQVGIEAERAIGTATVQFRFALFNGNKLYKGDANSFPVFDLSGETPKAVRAREHKTRRERDRQSTVGARRCPMETGAETVRLREGQVVGVMPAKLPRLGAEFVS